MSKLLHVLKSKEIYRGRLIQLRVDRIVEPGGVTVEREVVHHPGSVVILAHSDDGGIVLVRQYRYAAKQSLWELIAGVSSLEKDRSPLRGANYWKRPAIAPRNCGSCSISSPARGSSQRRCSWSKRLD